MRDSVRVSLGWMVLGVGGMLHAQPAKKPPVVIAKSCRRAVFEGDVRAGEGFEKVFARGLKFYLEPLRSGWIVRVLADGEPRVSHDFAGLATPPYNSVSSLLVSTDWSFRAQDAISWNPRRFRYAGRKDVFLKLEALYAGVVAGDAASGTKAAELVAAQPEGVLRILEARLVPGLADQAQMASSVATHLDTTPHTVDQSIAPSPLGAVEEMRFRVELDLLPGVVVSKGLTAEPIVCPVEPTGVGPGASEHVNRRAKK